MRERSTDMPGKRREIEQKLAKLPKSFTAEEINKMYMDLCADVNLPRDKNIPRQAYEAELHKKHQTLAYSYPNLFFKTVRGEMDKHIFDTLMKLKRRVDDGDIDDKRAKELVIDGARRHVEGEAPRVARPAPVEGGTVQEINLKCKVEED